MSGCERAQMIKRITCNAVTRYGELLPPQQRVPVVIYAMKPARQPIGINRVTFPGTKLDVEALVGLKPGAR